ncbi:hypothetical protein YPPY32_3514, partial [Yersinia pestis PY-32]
MATLTALRSG